MLYNHIIIDRISFGSPYERKKQFFIRDEKIIKSVYYADISYNNNCLYVKIPESEIKYIEIKNNDTYCYLRGKKFYSNFIEPLEQYIIHTLYTNSEKWFNGKRFSHEKISKCLVSNMYDGYKLCITNKDKIQNGCDLYIHLKELQFIDNRFTYNLILIDNNTFLEKKYAKKEKVISKDTFLEKKYAKKEKVISKDTFLEKKYAKKEKVILKDTFLEKKYAKEEESEQESEEESDLTEEYYKE